MEKKSAMKEVKRQDILAVVVGMSVLFSALMAVWGNEALSVSSGMVLAVFCVLEGMAKNLYTGMEEEE